jgi:DNA-binding PadR family transcriptional regulator
MFSRHQHRHAHHSRHPFGFHGHGHAHHRRGGRVGRFFDHGDVRLVVLKLIAEQPRYGYELIKAIEEASGGAYSPSPGVIYPTLTQLEEQGYASASDGGGGKRLFTITSEGAELLAQSDAPVRGLFERMADVAGRSAAFSPQILRARENLKTAMKIKLTGEKLSDEQVAAIAAALDEAARKVEQA